MWLWGGMPALMDAGGSAPATAQYVTLAVDGSLTVERVLTAGEGITLTDAGAGSTITIDAAPGYEAQGRLTLTSGTPVTTADVTGAATLYYALYTGDQIAVYDGSADWDVLTFAETSLDVSGYTVDKNYDIFGYNNGGTFALEGLVWTNDSTRATALTTQNGILVKTGATTRRYLGTIRTSGAGTIDDSEAFRGVWNYYNRVWRYCEHRVISVHTYGTATWRSFDNDATNRFELVIGVSEDAFYIGIWASIDPAADDNPGYVALAMDSTSTGGQIDMSSGNLWPLQVGSSTGEGPITAGYHYFQITQYATSGNVGFALAEGSILLRG
jgi:hypothetical protein